jgi:hypothetical protein
VLFDRYLTAVEILRRCKADTQRDCLCPFVSFHKAAGKFQNLKLQKLKFPIFAGHTGAKRPRTKISILEIFQCLQISALFADKENRVVVNWWSTKKVNSFIFI